MTVEHVDTAPFTHLRGGLRRTDDAMQASAEVIVRVDGIVDNVVRSIATTRNHTAVPALEVQNAIAIASH